MNAQIIQSNMRELKSITTEMKRLNIELKTLKLKKKEIEKNIKKFIEQTDQPGVKYGDLTVLAEQKKQRLRKSKDERNQEIAQILEDYGLTNVNDVLDEINEALKGKQELTMKLKIKENNS
jgi:hypothetical protein